MVIPARNAAGTIARQLEALCHQAYGEPWEVVVADNGSSDGTRRVAGRFRSRLPALRVVDASRASGINVARNEGARAARGDLILFCDADDVVADGWIRAMARGLEQAAAVGGRVDHWTLNPPESRLRGGPGSSSLLGDGFSFLPYPFGCNCGVRKAVFDELDGFDERFAHGGTEAEFFWRAQLAGHTLLFVPEGVVHYRHREGLWPAARQTYRRGRTQPLRYRMFRRHGMPRRLGQGLRWWGWLLLRWPDLLRSPSHRRRWISVLAMRVGRLVGSLKHRTLYL